MSTYASLTMCPQCHHLRNPKGPCPYCRRAARKQRHVRGLAFAAGILGLIILALLLSSCTGGDSSAGDIQPPTKRTLSEIRAEAMGETLSAPTPALPPVPVPTAIIPAALPPDEVDWAAWALRLGYRWCAKSSDGQNLLMGDPDGPRPIEPALAHICPP